MEFKYCPHCGESLQKEYNDISIFKNELTKNVTKRCIDKNLPFGKYVIVTRKNGDDVEIFIARLTFMLFYSGGFTGTWQLSKKDDNDVQIEKEVDIDDLWNEIEEDEFADT